MIRSFPAVNKSLFFKSTSSDVTCCLISWNVARGARLETKTKMLLQKPQPTCFRDRNCYSLGVGNGLEAVVTHTHFRFKTQVGQSRLVVATFNANRFATLATVVLKIDKQIVVHVVHILPLRF